MQANDAYSMHQAYLGAMMVETEAADMGLKMLRSEHFPENRQKMVYDAIYTIRSRNENPFVWAVFQETKRRNESIDIKYLTDCIQKCSSVLHLPLYEREIMREYLDSQLSLAANALVNVPDNKSSIEEELRAITVQRDALDAPVSEGFGWHWFLEELTKHPTKPMKLGLNDIDNQFGGLEPGDVFTVGGRTAHGKTSFLSNVAYNMAKMGKTVLIFSSETTRFQYYQRLLAIETGTTLHDFRRRAVPIKTISDGISRLYGLPIIVDPTSSPSLDHIKRKIFESKADVVIVDHLQRCQFPKSESFRIGVKEYMRGFKNMAKDNKFLGIMASQISRSVDRFKEAKPVLADLLESSDIENESDQVVLLWIEPKEMEFTGAVTLQAIVAKNRYGPCGIVNLVWDRATGKMKDAE